MNCYKHIIFLLGSLCSQLQAAEIRVAAASNLRYVLPELAEQFEQNTHHYLTITYAASGTLTTQIQHGAPFDVFMSASTGYIDLLKNVGLIQGNVLNYAQAQQVLFLPHHSVLLAEEGMRGLKKALEQNSLQKIAIANPRHASYGQAAMHELERLGIWSQIQPHLLMAENALQVTQFSLSSSVDAGFIPYSHAIQPQLLTKGSYIKLEIRLPQQAILIRGATVNAKQLLAFFQTDHARDILRQQGFIVEADH